MDEFEQGGMDPQVTRYFRKIISSFSFGMLWMLIMSTSGIYFRLALVEDSLKWYNILFYIIFLLTLFLLLRFLYNTWKDA